MDVSFFTWNIKNNKDANFFSDLNSELVKCKTDVLILQECYKEHPIKELTDYFEIPEFLKHPDRKYVRIFLKRKTTLARDMPTSNLSNKLRCIKLTTPNGYDFNLVGVHLYSKTGSDDADQFELNLTTASLITQFEALSKTKNTIVIGDLNHHPFDIDLQSTFIFNSLNDRQLIKALKTKRHLSVDYPFYYNPMWNLLGDHNYNGNNLKVPGSFFRHSDRKSIFHWNLLDGVLLSTPMMDTLNLESLKILTSINGKNLVDYTKVSNILSVLTSGFSDHLPVMFTIKTN